MVFQVMSFVLCGKMQTSGSKYAFPCLLCGIAFPYQAAGLQNLSCVSKAALAVRFGQPLRRATEQADADVCGTRDKNVNHEPCALWKLS